MSPNEKRPRLRAKKAGMDVIPTEEIRSAPMSDLEREARRQRKKVATTAGGFGKSANYDVASSSGGSFYSPQLSTDFLEKPQNMRERRAWYRHFYYSDEIVGAAIDLHSTLPLSRIRLSMPKCKSADLRDYIYDFYQRMIDRLNLTQVLMEASHEFNLFGNAFLYAEENSPYDFDPEDEESKQRAQVEIIKGKKQLEFLYTEFKIVDKDPNYLGWDKIYILPPDQVQVKKMPFNEVPFIEFLPDAETKSLLAHHYEKDGFTGQSMYENEDPMDHVPKKLAESMTSNGTLPLNTDPMQGSHVYHLARKKSQYETWGQSVLERCVNTLLYKDKLRQAQTSIASRHMTPIRIIWAEEMAEIDVDNLRQQVDLALQDPDFSIVANFEVHWEEIGSNGRLLELSSESELINNNLFAGLEVTREMLTGEASYSGNRMTLEVLNTKYMLFREQLKHWVDKYLFKPVAIKKGFVETDRFNNVNYIYPELSFTRLAIRDNDTYFEQVMQLYNKGSVPVDDVLDILNIDPEQSRKKLEADMFTVNDAAFQDLLRALYSNMAEKLVTNTNVADIVSKNMGITAVPQPAEGGDDAGGGDGGMGLRFASEGKGPIGNKQQEMLAALMKYAMENPDALEAISAKLGVN